MDMITVKLRGAKRRNRKRQFKVAGVTVSTVIILTNESGFVVAKMHGSLRKGRFGRALNEKIQCLRSANTGPESSEVVDRGFRLTEFVD